MTDQPCHRNDPQGRRKTLAELAGEIVALDQPPQPLTLRTLRESCGLTQAAMAAKLGIIHTGVVKIEHRRDPLLSTIANYVETLGGDLRLVVDLPGRPPAELTGFTTGRPERRKPGRPPKMTPAKIADIEQMIRDTDTYRSISAVVAALDIDTTTFYRHFRPERIAELRGAP